VETGDRLPQNYADGSKSVDRKVYGWGRLRPPIHTPKANSANEVVIYGDLLKVADYGVRVIG
jgi:hypothetical protein